MDREATLRHPLMKSLVSILLSTIMTVATAQSHSYLQPLAKEFFIWRTATQPATGDDIPRVERPDGWVPDVSPQALENQRKRYREFRVRLQEMPRTGWTRRDSVNYLLMRSAVERVNWELNVLRLPHRNPDFYVHQTLGVLFELLLISSPMTENRARNIILRLESIPTTLDHAHGNLTEPVEPFAEIALQNLENIRDKLEQTARALKKIFPGSLRPDLDAATHNAITALEAYRGWLKETGTPMAEEFHVGREGYEYFLKNIALNPHSPEELLLRGRQEWDRSVLFHSQELLRNKGVRKSPLFRSAKQQIHKARRDEASIRMFLEDHRIVSVPDGLMHYTNREIPDHLAPLAYMGVTDDLTSRTRLDENAVSYIPEPAADLSFFRLASAQDPRPIIVHEGIPGHYLQLALSWKNPDEIRRNFFDSGVNEGIAFYVEEMMLQIGLFDDRPHTREIIYRFMRLRALRVEVDVKLALGDFSIQEASRYLAETVPLDPETAAGEARFFAYNPGQAISYQIGKLQIQAFLSDAIREMGDQFRLRDFHDYLMVNGNVPVPLQRWEYLGLRDEIDTLW